MRGLLPALACAQALGILLADLELLASTRALALGGAALAAGALLRGARCRAGAALVLALAGGALALALRLEQARAAQAAAPFTGGVEARVADVRSDAGGLRVELEHVRSVAPARAIPAQRLMLRLPPESRAEEVEPGATLRMALRLAAPRTLRNPGPPRDPRRLARRGIGVAARPEHPALIARLHERPGLAARVQRERRRLAERLSALGEGGALLRALGLGDAAGLAPETRAAFVRLGLAHLLAVSGLHLALVAGGAYAAARRLLARSATLAARTDVRAAARVAALLAAIGYALLCGFGVPVRRALVLLAVAVASAAHARRSPPLQALAGASILVLAAQPAALFAPGAQLSFAACAALVWDASRTRRDPVGAPGGRIARAAGASATAVAATAPLAAWHWGVAAPASVAVNLLAIPWTGLVLLPTALSAVAAAALPASRPAGAVLVLAERLGALTLHAGQWLAAPIAAGPDAPLHPLVLLASAALGLLAISTRALRVRAALATLLCVGLWWAPPAALAPAPPRLVALDVGRGDAVLVQGRRAALLIDAAAAVPDRYDLGASVVVPALHALGVRRLDLVIATHADLDHRGGLPAVLADLPVGAIWVPPGGSDEPDFAGLRAAAAAAQVCITEAGRGAPALRIGDLRVTPIWPEVGRGGPRNERSLAVRIEVGAHRLLLLGDLGAAEPALLREEAHLRADVLLLPHHGSRHSSSEALLAAVAPQLAIVSAPCPPQRGLPHPAALARARRRTSLWWTGRDGAVLVGLGERLRAIPFAVPRDCDQDAATFSVPSKASTSGRHTKRTGGRVTSASATEAETGW